MVKSKSAYVIKKKYADSSTSSDEEVKETTRKKRVEFDSIVKKIPRDPISVPNFSVLNLTTPVLTPVEASKLVYLTDEETDIELKVANHHSITEVKTNFRFLQPKFSEHLGPTCRRVWWLRNHPAAAAQTKRQLQLTFRIRW